MVKRMFTRSNRLGALWREALHGGTQMFRATRQSILTVVLISGFSGAARGQAAAFPWEGEVSGTNVYVRSGAGANWYPTTKLNAGQRVLVLGEKYGWYQITPPSGSFSYVDMAMVERAPGGKTGVIKSDKVYVRAGSQIEQRKNATQLVLNKGAVVDILGEAEGFFKIAPPSGAALYISKQYVKPIDPKLSSGLVERHQVNRPAQSSTAVAAQPPPQPEAPKPTAPETAPPAQIAMNAPADGASKSTPPAAFPSAAAADDTLEPEPAPGAVARGPAEDSLVIPKPAGQGEALTAAPQPATPIIPSPRPAEGGQTPSASVASSTPGSQPAPAKPVTPASAGPSDGKVVKFPAVNNVQAASAGTKADAAPAPTVEPVRNRYQTMLATCESELVSLLAKPLEQQDPTSLLAKYEEIASQSGEFVPAEVAKIRVRQLKERMALRQSQLALGSDEKAIATYRANMENERMAIMRRRVEQALDTFDIEGELRRSLAFGQEERRYRLVNPESGTTLAYVDIPKSVDENPDHLIGRRVGIKVAGRTFSPAARVPIAVARQVVDVSARERLPQSDRLPLPETPAYQSQPSLEAAPVRQAPPPAPSQEPSEALEQMRQLEPGIHLAPGSTDDGQESAGRTDRAISSSGQYDDQ